MPIRSPRTAVAVAAVLAALAAAPRAGAAPAALEDDDGRALAEARRLGVPMLVDVWAPW